MYPITVSDTAMLFERRFLNKLLTLPPEPARFQQSHDTKAYKFQNIKGLSNFSVFLEELETKKTKQNKKTQLR